MREGCGLVGWAEVREVCCDSESTPCVYELASLPLYSFINERNRQRNVVRAEEALKVYALSRCCSGNIV